MRRTLLALFVALCSPCIAAAQTGHEGDIDPPDLFEETLDKVGRLYLHPDAVVPQRMAREAIQQLENLDPGVLVLGGPTGPLEVRSGGSAQSFSVDDLDDLRSLRARLEDVVDFILAHPPTREEPLQRDDLQEDAIEGMLRTIDRHSRLIVGDGLDEFNTRFKGTLVGIGARVGRRAGHLRVIEPFEGAPASRAGLRAQDIISHVDGQSTTGMAVDEAVERIRGPEGVPVVLTIQRPGEDGRRIFVIRREKVLVPSVESEELPDAIGYIAVDHFSQKTSQEFTQHLDKLQEDQPLRGLIIDLRENTGGSMRHAARIVNAFVEEGTLVRTEGHDGEQVQQLTPAIPANARYKRFDGPVAVLVNRRTASGSEIVAGGLKVLERSITIGSQTFGKGTVQKVYALRQGEDPASLKLTVARYLLPGDIYINAVGVTPDVVTGQLWLDPDEPTLPDVLSEPAIVAGRTDGEGGLDSKHNPGGGERPPSVEGSQAAPALALFYPRVLDGWTTPDEAKPGGAKPGDAGPGRADPDDADHMNAEPTEPDKASDEPPVEQQRPPGWSSHPGDAGDDLFNDMELRLAHDILRGAEPEDRRKELIQRAGPVVGRWQEQQGARLEQAATARKLVWAAGSAGWMDRAPSREDAWQARMQQPPPPGLDAALLVPTLQAGEAATIRATVTNRTERPLRHLRARVESSLGVLDGASFLFGDLPPGAAGSWSIDVQVDGGAPTRADTWRMYLIDDQGPLGGPTEGVAEVRGHELPELQVRARTEVRPEPDGSVTVVATVGVRNATDMDAGEIQVWFGQPKAEDVERLERYATIEELKGGQDGEVTLSLRVRSAASTALVPVRLRAHDRVSGASTTVKLELPTSGALDSDWFRPADVELQVPVPGGAPARSGPDFAVVGSVAAKAGLEAVEVFVGRDKVFSRSFLGEEGKPPRKLPINAPALLEKGPNRVTVRVRTADGVSSSRVAWVLGLPDGP